MADPEFPQPASYFTRVRLAGDGGAGETPFAKPIGTDPVAEASPTAPGAPVPEGTYSRAYGGFSIDPRWLNQLALNDDKVLTLEGGHNLELYDALLDDDICQSGFQQRRLAVISRPWEVEPGAEDAQAKAAADHLREQLKRLDWDRICDRQLFGNWYGYGVGEGMYELGQDSKIWLQDIIIPDRKWFGFTNRGELRMRTAENAQGEVVPDNKFWAFRAGGNHDFLPYGRGLAHWCYWPVWFKRNVVKFWAIYLEKFGMPTALGKFAQGALKEVQDNLLAAAAAVGRDAAVVIPDDAELELLAEGRTGTGTYQEFVKSMDDALLRIILSQTGTSKSEAQGLGGSQSEVHKDVRDEVVKADSDLLHSSFNRTFAKWLTEWNFGPNVAVPTVYRRLDDEEDLNTVAERDVKLYGIGIRRTEELVAETYGDGYEVVDLDAQKAEAEERAIRLAAETKAEAGGQPGADKPGANGKDGKVVNIEDARKKKAAQFAADDPRPLYIHRDLKPGPAKALLAWAEKAGIPNLLPAAELHTTVLYSKQAVDWFDLANDWADTELKVNKGGPRAIVKLGEKGAIVLRFGSGQLKWRHEELVERGASHDFDDYRPHVTIAYAPDFDPDTIDEAFQGELVFGPEIFEAIDPDWMDRIAKREFSAEDMDAIERFAAAMAGEADPIIAEFAASLKGKLEGIRDVDGLRIALLEGLEKFPAERLAELTGLSFVAERATAEVGLEGAVQA